MSKQTDGEGARDTGRSREKSGATGQEGWRSSGGRVRGPQGSQNRLGSLCLSICELMG